MFYCKVCQEKNKWPASLAKSIGNCEVCGTRDLCNDVKSSNLPIMSKCTKGKLEVDGYTYLKDSKCKVVATTNHINGLDFEQQKANAKEIKRRWNAFEEGGLVDELRTAAEVGLDATNALLKIDIKSNFSKNEKDIKEIIKFVEAALAKS